MRSIYFDNLSGLSHNTVHCVTQDSRGFMWFGTRYGLDRFDGHEYRISHRTGPHGGLRGENIFCLQEGKDGRLWIGTDNGLCIYDPQTDTFTDFDTVTADGIAPTEAVRRLQMTDDGSIWMLSGGRLFRYAPDGTLHHFGATLPSTMTDGRKAIYAHRSAFYLALSDGLYSSFDNGATFDLITTYDFEPSLIYEYGIGKLLLGTRSEGLYIVDTQTGRMTMAEAEAGCSIQTDDFYPHSIVRIDESEFWIGSESGLYLLRDGRLANLPDYSPRQADVVLDVFKDRRGGVWVANNFDGVIYYPRRHTMFDCYSARDHTLSGNIVRSVIEDDAGTMYVCTEDGGLSRSLPADRVFTGVIAADGTNLTALDIQCSLYSRYGKVLLGTYRDGLYIYDVRSGDTRHYMNRKDVFTARELHDGRILFGSTEGIFLLDIPEDTPPTPFLHNVPILTDIVEDRHGILWLLTENGLFRYDPYTSQMRTYTSDASNPASLCSNYLTQGLLDTSGQLWLSSEGGGLCRYDEASDRFERLTISDGLPSNAVNCMVEADDHTLWVGTNDGLAIIDLSNRQLIATFGVEDGLPSKHITLKSATRLANGQIAIGTFGGLVLADGTRGETSDCPHDVCLTGLYIHNEEVTPQSPSSARRFPILTRAMPYTDALRLRHGEGTFTLSFTTFDYAHEGQDLYTYRLQGFDKQWNYSGKGAGRISYHNVPPGHYRLRIRPAENNATDDGTETQLSIRILPPWWASPGSIALYVLLVVSVVFLIARAYRRRSRERQEQARLERQRQEDARLYQAKIDFFTNIAHEIRTPASLIRDPLHSLQKKELPQDVKQTLSLIERSAENLNNLINELLEFRQAEAGTSPISRQTEDLTVLVRDTWDEFQPAAAVRGLHTRIDLPPQPVLVSVDARAMKKILGNLISNAVKYAGTYIRLRLETDEARGMAVLTQTNDGALVPPDMRQKIFEPFVQVRDERMATQGTGLGLALASSLAKLQGCTLRMSTDAADNTFVLETPLTLGLGVRDEELAGTPRGDVPAEAERTTLLVVEDHADLRTYLASRLRERYEVLEAADGVEALQLLEKHIVHLVLSDVMMPRKDGLELCHDIKSNIELCHIPVVLLTAKAAVEDYIQGLEDGADAYIGKPFETEHVEAQIASLLENRRLLREKFAHEPMATFSTIAHDRADERLIKEVTDCVVQHIDESEWNIDNLSEAMHMSRSTLSRKIKVLTDQTPSDFIRLIRLRHAAQLLLSGDYRLNEVSTMVGFNSPHYFSTLFQQQFGVKPSDYAASIGKGK